jgi:hypothetical protein
MGRAGWIAVFFAVVCGCGGGSSSTADALVGDWIFQPTTDSALAVTFKGDGTYVQQTLQLTSTNSADDEIEGGTFTADGSTLKQTPTKWSCPGPDPISSVSYTVTSTQLTVIAGANVFSLARTNFSSSGGSPMGAVLTTGCFDSNGTFTPAAIAPVTN